MVGMHVRGNYHFWPSQMVPIVLSTRDTVATAHSLMAWLLLVGIGEKKNSTKRVIAVVATDTKRVLVATTRRASAPMHILSV